MGSVGHVRPHKLPLFDGRELAMVANAFTRLQIRDDLLLDDIADEAICKDL